MKIIKNPDAATYKEVTDAVKANNGYCPCAIEKTEDTRCPCKEFREQQTEGECHCGRFVKVKEEADMNENTCEHVIGMIYAYEDTGLATLKILKEHIEDQERLCKNFWKSSKPHTLSDYADRRKTTDLTRFNHCPNCGEKIDWKAIRMADNEQRN